MPDQNNSSFGLWKKWFWIGIVVAMGNIISGLIYGIALALEKDHRKEGIIIIVFGIVWTVVLVMWLAPWLQEVGLMKRFVSLPPIQ